MDIDKFLAICFLILFILRLFINVNYTLAFSYLVIFLLHIRCSYLEKRLK